MNKKFNSFSIIITLLVISLPMYAKVIKFTRPIRFGVECKTLYDDNIYLYSKEYISDFQNQVRAYRFPINTYDDLITNIDLSLRIPFYFKTYINLYYKQYLYTMNAEKSYQILSASVNKKLTRPLNFRVSYLYMPRYLIRYYRDPLGSSTQFIGCTFSEHLSTVSIEYSLSKIKLNPFVRYEMDDYRKNFKYYNSKAFRYGLNIGWTINKLTNINLGFESKQNNAKGPVPDISYNNNNISAKFVIRLPSYEKLGVVFGGDYSKRNFTTTNTALTDPYHENRSDDCLNVTGGLFIRFTRNFQVNIDYERETRKVQSPNLIYIEDIKNYSNNKIVLGLKYNPAITSEED